MRKVNLLCVVAIGAAVASLWTPTPLASSASGMTPEIAEKERRRCVTCHTALGRPDLNEAGDYYKENRTLEGYPGELPPPEGPAPEEPER